MNNKTHLYAFILTFSMGIIYFILFSFIRFNDCDTPNFIHAAKILFGLENAIDMQSRITKPFVLLIPGFLDYAFGVAITKTMLVQNSIFFVFTGIVFAKLLKEFGFDLQKQLLGVFILFTIQPIVVHAFELINDMSGYFFTIVILYYYFKIKHQNILIFKQYALLSIFLIAGILSKESAGLSAVVIVIDSLLDYKKYRFYKNSLCILISAVFIFVIQVSISMVYHYQTNMSNLFDKFQETNGIIFRLEQFIHSFDVYWIYIVLGIIILIKNKNIEYSQKLILISSIVCMPFLFLWPLVQDRTISVAAPLFVPVILYALSAFVNTKRYIVLIVLGGIFNVVCSYIIYRYQTPNLLKIYYSSYAILFLIMYTSSRKIISE